MYSVCYMKCNIVYDVHYIIIIDVTYQFSSSCYVYYNSYYSAHSCAYCITMVYILYTLFTHIGTVGVNFKTKHIHTDVDNIHIQVW